MAKWPVKKHDLHQFPQLLFAAQGSAALAGQRANFPGRYGETDVSIDSAWLRLAQGQIIPWVQSI